MKLPLGGGGSSINIRKAQGISKEKFVFMFAMVHHFSLICHFQLKISDGVHFNGNFFVFVSRSTLKRNEYQAV